MDHPKFHKALRGLLTRSPRLRRELTAALREDIHTRRAGSDRDYHVWQSLQKLCELAPEALKLLHSNREDLEAWHEDKINLAAEYLEAVVDSLLCKAEHEVSPFHSEEDSEDVGIAEPADLADSGLLETEDFE